jgi:type I restriction enzyme S subunit
MSKKKAEPVPEVEMPDAGELPEGWTRKTLLEIAGGDAKLVVGGPFGSCLQVSDYRKEGIPILRLQNVGHAQFIDKDIKYITPEKAKELEYHTFQKGDLVLAKLGDPIGKTCIVPEKYDQGIVVSDVVRIRLDNDQIEKKYLQYYLNSPESLRQLNFQVFGSTRPRVNLKEVRNISVLVPPLPEQQRIVARIEALLAHVNEARGQLQRMPAIMKQFRQGVLAAACSGRLTEGWREENPNIQTGSQLLTELNEKRKSIKKIGKTFEDDFVFTDLHELPDTWAWSTIQQTAERVTVGHVGPMKDEYRKGGIPFLRCQNVRENYFDPDGLVFISPEFHELLKKSALEPRDLVVVRSGNVGTCCVIPESLKNANCSDLVIVKQPYGFLPKFGAFYINSIAHKWIDDGKVGIALSHFNTKSVATLPIPIAPISEQHEIVRRVDALFDRADAIEREVVAATKRAEALTQAVLGKAFRGELVTPGKAEG